MELFFFLLTSRSNFTQRPSELISNIQTTCFRFSSTQIYKRKLHRNHDRAGDVSGKTPLLELHSLDFSFSYCWWKYFTPTELEQMRFCRKILILISRELFTVTVQPCSATRGPNQLQPQTGRHDSSIAPGGWLQYRWGRTIKDGFTSLLTAEPRSLLGRTDILYSGRKWRRVQHAFKLYIFTIKY